MEHDLAIYAQTFGTNLFRFQDYKNNEIDAVIELEDGYWCAFEIKLGAKKIDEGLKILSRYVMISWQTAEKAPKIMCVICGLFNSAYVRIAQYLLLIK